MQKANRISFYSTCIAYLIPVLAISLGGMFYIFLRTSSPEFVNWFAPLGLRTWLIHLGENSNLNQEVFPYWFIYSMPDLLWSLGYSFIISYIWRHNASFIRYVWMASIPALIFGMEFLQLSNHLPGTFSINDLIFCFLGIMAGYLIATKLNFKYYEKSN